MPEKRWIKWPNAPPPKLSGANLLDLGTKGKVKKVFGEAEKQNSIIRHAFCYLRYDFLWHGECIVIIYICTYIKSCMYNYLRVVNESLKNESPLKKMHRCDLVQFGWWIFVWTPVFDTPANGKTAHEAASSTPLRSGRRRPKQIPGSGAQPRTQHDSTDLCFSLYLATIEIHFEYDKTATG